MGIKTMDELHSKVYDICDQLVANNKLVTAKMVLSVIDKIPEMIKSTNCDANLNLLTKQKIYKLEFNNTNNHLDENNISGIINSWRLSRIISANNKKVANKNSCKKSLNSNNCIFKFRQQLIQAKREIRILKAKIKALNSFYNRQRQEFIMRIEGMLYK